MPTITEESASLTEEQRIANTRSFIANSARIGASPELVELAKKAIEGLVTETDKQKAKDNEAAPKKS